MAFPYGPRPFRTLHVRQGSPAKVTGMPVLWLLNSWGERSEEDERDIVGMFHIVTEVFRHDAVIVNLSMNDRRPLVPPDVRALARDFCQHPNHILVFYYVGHGHYLDQRLVFGS